MRNKKRFVMLMVVSCVVLLALAILYVTGMSGSAQQNGQKAESEARETAVEAELTESSQAEAELMIEIMTESSQAEIETMAESSQVEAVDDVDSFYYMPLTDELKEYITGRSYPDTDEPLQISYEDLAYVHVLHYDFEGQIQEGELICNQTIAQDLTEIFKELYDNQYPIEKIRLIDAYDADDDASMEDNNTSCFNYRVVEGKTTLSNHSYGLAIDVNPFYNPYVRTKDGNTLVSPEDAVPYADRSADFPYKIDENDLCCQLFAEHGFTWGGNWNSVKDYQHFEKVIKEQ